MSSQVIRKYRETVLSSSLLKLAKPKQDSFRLPCLFSPDCPLHPHVKGAMQVGSIYGYIGHFISVVSGPMHTGSKKICWLHLLRNNKTNINSNYIEGEKEPTCVGASPTPLVFCHFLERSSQALRKTIQHSIPVLLIELEIRSGYDYDPLFSLRLPPAQKRII